MVPLPLNLPTPAPAPDQGGPIACLGCPVAYKAIPLTFSCDSTLKNRAQIKQNILRHCLSCLGYFCGRYVEKIFPNWRWHYSASWGIGQIQIRRPLQSVERVGIPWNPSSSSSSQPAASSQPANPAQPASQPSRQIR